MLATAETRVAVGEGAGAAVRIRGLGERSHWNVNREALLREMLRGVPAGVVRPGPSGGSGSGSGTKAIVSVAALGAGQGQLITFDDGTQERYDVVVGAEGAHGFTRRLVLGDDEALVKPRATGFWGLPIKVPLRRAQEVMGAGELLDPRNPRQMGWIGDGTMMLCNMVDGGDEVQIIVHGKTDGEGEGEGEGDKEPEWAKLFTTEEFREMFAGYRVPMCQGMVDVSVNKCLSAYSMRKVPPLPPPPLAFQSNNTSPSSS